MGSMPNVLLGSCGENVQCTDCHWTKLLCRPTKQITDSVEQMKAYDH